MAKMNSNTKIDVSLLMEAIEETRKSILENGDYIINPPKPVKQEAFVKEAMDAHKEAIKKGAGQGNVDLGEESTDLKKVEEDTTLGEDEVKPVDGVKLESNGDYDIPVEEENVESKADKALKEAQKNGVGGNGKLDGDAKDLKKVEEDTTLGEDEVETADGVKLEATGGYEIPVDKEDVEGKAEKALKTAQKNGVGGNDKLENSSNVKKESDKTPVPPKDDKKKTKTAKDVPLQNKGMLESLMEECIVHDEYIAFMESFRGKDEVTDSFVDKAVSAFMESHGTREKFAKVKSLMESDETDAIVEKAKDDLSELKDKLEDTDELKKEVGETVSKVVGTGADETPVIDVENY